MRLISHLPDAAACRVRPCISAGPDRIIACPFDVSRRTVFELGVASGRKRGEKASPRIEVAQASKHRASGGTLVPNHRQDLIARLMREDFIRPRLVLVTTLLPDGEAGEAALRSALAGGDVASVIVDPAGRDEAAFQLFAEALVPLIQDHGAAALVADDTRCAGRTKADGLHLSKGDLAELDEAIGRYAPKLIVGASGFSTRHEALEAGERIDRKSVV